MRSVGLNCDALDELRYRGPGAYGEQYLAYCRNGAEFYITEKPNGQRVGSARGAAAKLADAFEEGFTKGVRGE